MRTNFYGMRVIVLSFLLVMLERASKTQATLKVEELHVFPTKVNHQGAVEGCKKLGMSLVRVQSKEDNKLVYDFSLRSKLGRFWIDVNDRKTVGQWVYEDGSKITFSNWAVGEPNYLDTEKCGEIGYYPDGLWNNIPCTGELPTICVKNGGAKDDSENELC